MKFLKQSDVRPPKNVSRKHIWRPEKLFSSHSSARWPVLACWKESYIYSFDAPCRKYTGNVTRKNVQIDRKMVLRTQLKRLANTDSVTLTV